MSIRLEESWKKRLSEEFEKNYFKDSNIKLEIALGKGKKKHDKRQDQAKKDVERKLRQKSYDF